MKLTTFKLGFCTCVADCEQEYIIRSAESDLVGGTCNCTLCICCPGFHYCNILSMSFRCRIMSRRMAAHTPYETIDSDDEYGAPYQGSSKNGSRSGYGKPNISSSRGSCWFLNFICFSSNLELRKQCMLSDEAHTPEFKKCSHFLQSIKAFRAKFSPIHVSRHHEWTFANSAYLASCANCQGLPGIHNWPVVTLARHGCGPPCELLPQHFCTA